MISGIFIFKREEIFPTYFPTQGIIIFKPCKLLLSNTSKYHFQKRGNTTQITLPVYLNNTRTTLVETLDFPTDEVQFYERGVAILCTSLS